MQLLRNGKRSKPSDRPHRNYRGACSDGKDIKKKSNLRKLGCAAKKLFRPFVRAVSRQSHALRRGRKSKKPIHSQSKHGTERKRDKTILSLLEEECAVDIVPHMLSFVGPKTVFALVQVDKRWNEVVSQDIVWKVMSEEFHKWRIGNEIPKVPWKEYYRRNPCVPTDYRDVHKALAAVQENGRGGTILLRPGYHFLRESLVIRSDPSIEIRFKTIVSPRSNLIIDGEDSEETEMRAILSRLTYHRNQPLLQIKCGKVSIEEVGIDHFCVGTDLWGGNSAIHIAKSEKDLDSTLHLRNVDVSSSSGRGLVAAEGAYVQMTQTFLHGCAATGLYMSGQETRVDVHSCDIVDNGVGSIGMGNIPSGQSGIFVVDGFLRIEDSNISSNKGAGLSFMSKDEAPSHLSICSATSINDNVGGIMSAEEPLLGSHKRRSCRPRTKLMKRLAALELD